MNPIRTRSFAPRTAEAAIDVAEIVATPAAVDV
jgi:hypothetical protein